MRSKDPRRPARAVRSASAVEAAKPEREREARRRIAGERDLGGLQDVAVGCAVVVEVERVVAGEVGPAVARADEAARGPREAARPDQRARHVAVAGEQRDVVPASAPERGVMARGVAQRGIEEREEAVVARREGLERDPEQDRRAHRVGHVGLRQAVAAGARRVDLRVGQRALVREPDRVRRVLALAVGERRAVGHRELERAHVGGVAAREVDLAETAVREGVPDLRAAARGGPEPLLAARRPVGRGARRPGRGGLGAGGGRRDERHQDREPRAPHPHPAGPRFRRAVNRVSQICYIAKVR